jgi:hypothetical protein
MDMGKAIYLLSRKVRGSGANIRILRIKGPIVRFLDNPGPTLEPFVGAPNFFAANVDIGLHLGKSFLIFLKSLDGRLATFLSKFGINPPPASI